MRTYAQRGHVGGGRHATVEHAFPPRVAGAPRPPGARQEPPAPRQQDGGRFLPGAEGRLDEVQQAILHERVHGHLRLHEVGPPEEVEVERSALAGRTPAAHDVAVLAERFIEQAQRIATNRVQQAMRRPGSRSRGFPCRALRSRHELAQQQQECHDEAFAKSAEACLPACGRVTHTPGRQSRSGAMN